MHIKARNFFNENFTVTKITFETTHGVSVEFVIYTAMEHSRGTQVELQMFSQTIVINANVGLAWHDNLNRIAKDLRFNTFNMMV